MTFLDATSMLATLAAVAVLSGQLRNVHDLCSLSSDIQRIGALVVLTIGKIQTKASPPPPRTRSQVPLALIPVYQ